MENFLKHCQIPKYGDAQNEMLMDDILPSLANCSKVKESDREDNDWGLGH